MATPTITGTIDSNNDIQYFETVVGIGTTGNVLKLSTSEVKVGGASNDVDFSVYGDGRLDLSNCTVAAAQTDGGVIKAGTSSSPVTEDTANMKFVSFYFDDGATSGDARGIYNRLYITGAGGGGESLRSFTTVSNVAGATAHGAHISLNFGTSGSVTGQGIATRSTLHMPSTALGASNVTYSALQAEIYSDGATSDPSGNKLSAIRVVNDGNATGMADVDDDCALFELMGWTDATGNMLYSNTLRIRVTTTDKYLVMSTTENELALTADGRINLSACTVAAANTDGGVIKCGTSGARVTEDTANMKFMSFYFDNGATSGDNRGMYLRQYLTGAGGGGEAARIFTTVENVAGGTAHGAHISLNFGTTGSVTGLGVGVRSTLHVPNQEQSGGTYAGGQSEVYFDGASAGLSGTTAASIHRFVVDGSSHTNDMDYVFEFVGLNSTQWETTYSDTPDRGLKIRVNGTAYWIACTTATT